MGKNKDLYLTRVAIIKLYTSGPAPHYFRESSSTFLESSSVAFFCLSNSARRALSFSASYNKRDERQRRLLYNPQTPTLSCFFTYMSTGPLVFNSLFLITETTFGSDGGTSSATGFIRRVSLGSADQVGSETSGRSREHCLEKKDVCVCEKNKWKSRSIAQVSFITNVSDSAHLNPDFYNSSSSRSDAIPVQG